MNSDYLALTQKNNSEFTAVFAPETFAGPTQIYNRYAEFTVPAIKGAIDEIMVSRNGQPYKLGASLWTGTVNPASIGLIINRINPTTIQVHLRVVVYNVSSYSMPMQTVKIKVSSFFPPNIF